MGKTAQDYADMFLKHLVSKSNKNLFLVLWSVEKRDEVLKCIDEMSDGLKTLIMNALNDSCLIRIAIADNENPNSLAGFFSRKAMVIILDQHEKASPEILEVLGANLPGHEGSKLYGN